MSENKFIRFHTFTLTVKFKILFVYKGWSSLELQYLISKRSYGQKTLNRGLKLNFDNLFSNAYNTLINPPFLIQNGPSTPIIFNENPTFYDALLLYSQFLETFVFSDFHSPTSFLVRSSQSLIIYNMANFERKILKDEENLIF